MLKTIMSALAAIILTISATGGAKAASKSEIDAKVTAALSTFYEEVSSGRELVSKAAGVLVFPEVVKAGFVVGGEYGEGALRVGGRTIDYYNIASASIGLQLGAQVKTEVILFMTQTALNDFRNSDGWEAGVDGSVALVTLGAGGEFDTNTIREPIIGFIISNKGLMYNLTFEGAKISKMD